MTDSEGNPSNSRRDGAKPAGATSHSGSASSTGSALMVLDHVQKSRIPNWLRQRATVIAIALGVGVLGGATLSFGVGYSLGNANASRDVVDPTEALRASVRQLAGEITALKAAVAGSNSGKTRVISPDVTGSIAPATAPADNWTLYRVKNGRALVQGNGGYYEVAPGSSLPGLGLVQRITRDNNEWIVQTRNGVIRSRS
ncbi:MAG: hypothetical protein GY798_03220 [Hyphomicrobiales bacterium]|nr:hypothetical protein [Hyphomicrobiales bacterium]